MKAKIYIGAKKYALYIGRKIIEKTLEFLTLPARFVSKKVQELKQYQIYGQSIQSNLPEGYIQLEYIASTTNQYINTGIKGELESELTFIGQRTGDNPNQTYGHLWGDLAVSARSISFNTPKSASGSGSSRFGDKATSSSTSPVKVIPLNTPVTIIQNKEKATASTGFEIVFGTTTEFETDNPLFLFTSALSGGGPTASSHKWRCEYFSHTKGGVLVQEFIPCKNAQGEIGMYDTVSGNFFASNTSTPFVAGPEVQPTPSNPIEIKSVGDKTVNLFNKDGEITNWYSSARLITTASANRTFAVRHIAGTKYYYKHCNVAGGGRYFYTTVENPELGSEASVMYGTTIIQPNQVVVVDSIPDDAKWVFFNAGRTGQTATAQEQLEDYIVTTTPMDESTPYEPYGKYKIPVTVTGKNILNPNAEVYNGYIGLMNVGEAIRYGSSTASKTYKKFAYFKPGVYTYSYNGSGSTGSLRFVLCDENEIVKEIVSTPVVQGRNEVTVTFTNEGWGYVSTLVVATDIQIEEGDIATPYEPYFNQTTNIYLDEPLRKLGELTDYIDYENQKVVRQVGAEKFGTANWTYESNYTRFSREFSTLKSTGTRMTYMTSDGFIAFTAGTGIATVPNNTFYTGASTSKSLYFKTDVYNTVSAFTNAMSETYVYFPTTPTEETIDLPAISLPSGTVTIDVDTEIEPSKIIITGDIDNE